MSKIIKNNFWYQIIFSIFILLTLWWVLLYFSGSKTGFPNYLFGAVYGTVMAGIGTYLGIKASKYWGGSKSVMGKLLILLSLGLFAEFFGQVIFSIYNIFLQVEVPYPSLADVGFFANIPFYLYAAFLLLKASGGRFNLRSITSQVQAVVVPSLMLMFSYYLFLQGYEFDFTNPLKIFLDFAYPLGQAFYVSIALLTYGLSKRTLGGVMRPKILLLIAAFIGQYIADFNFLFQSSNGTWYNGGYGDYLYLVAYFLMTLGLLGLSNQFVKKSVEKNNK